MNKCTNYEHNTNCRVAQAQEVLNQGGLMSLSSISPQHSQLVAATSARSDDSGAPCALEALTALKGDAWARNELFQRSGAVD